MKKIIFLCFAMVLFVLPWNGMSQITGSTCNNPLLVTSVPYNDSGDTATFGNYIQGSDRPALGGVTNGTGSTSYLNGADVVYSYTAGSNGFINIDATTSTDVDVSLWAFTGCPFATTEGYHTSTSGTSRSIPNLPVVSGTTYFIVISNWPTPSTTDYTISITGTQVQNPPTCLPPSNLSFSNPTASSVELAWTENGSAGTWDLEWGPKNFTPTGTPTNVGVTNPYTLSAGLSPQTEYDFYVRADCGSGDLSTWTGPYSFETACVSQLSGAYTIGASGDFTTLTAAVTALNDCGVSGATVFNVLPGSGPYNEQLTINEFMGASAANTVTFNGNGETLTASTTTGARSLFLLDGADYVTINNFNMVTIEATNNFVVQLTNDANNNTISNNTIDMTSTLSNTGSTNAGIVMSGSLTSASTSGVNGGNLTATDNTIIGGYYGIALLGDTPSHSMNNNITGNTIQDFYYYGVYLKYTSSGSVSENDIHRMNRISTSTFNGIYYNSGGENNVTNANTIHDSSTSESSGSSAYAIYHNSIDASVGNENIVSNNVIYNMNSASSLIYAIYNSGSDGVHYFYNTVSLDHAAATGGTTRGFYQTTTASGIEFKNNIISITRGGGGTKYAMYFNAAASVIVSDYNDLYVNAPAGSNYIGYLGGNQATLGDWQTATSGDMNSLDLDPMFAAPLFGGLSPTSPAVDDMGTPISGITTDIDGNTRSATTPDMGAYEFSPPSCPQPSSLSVTNITDSSADLMWQENGSAQKWIVEYGVIGFTQGTGTPVSVNGTPGYSIPTGTLSGSTEYDFYVTADCGGTLSAITGPASFITACVAVSNLPYTENFDTYGTGSNAFPSCWERPVTYTSGSVWPSIVTPTASQGSPTSAPNSLRFQAAVGTPTYAVSPAFTEDIHNLQVSFMLNREGNSSGTMEIGVMSDPLDINTFELVQTIDPTDFKVYKPYSFNLNTTTLSGANNHIALRHNSNSSAWYYWVDDFSVQLIPSCPRPTNLNASNVTSNSAELGWTAGGIENSWNIEIVAAGATPTGVATASGVTNPYTASLNPSSTYDFYVQADCTGGDLSTWAGPYTFSTLCVAVSDFSENFETTTGTDFPNCWDKVGTTGSADTRASTKISGARVLYVYNNVTVSMPVVDNASAGTHQMIMDVVGNFSSGATINFGYLTNPTDANSFVQISSIVTNSTTTPQEFRIIPTGVPTGDVTFAVNAPGATSSLIDNVRWEPIDGFVYDGTQWWPSDPNVNATASDNILVMNGSTVFTQDISVNNITIMSGGTLNVEKVLTIAGNITNNGNLVFVSTATGNGELAAVPATSTITGNATVQRYMSSNRSYRMVSSPVTTTTNIRANWQEGATDNTHDPHPGFGTHITGSTTDKTNGFDGTVTGNPSMFTVDVPNQLFVQVPRTDGSAILTAGEAYLLFVRGSRAINLLDDTAEGSTVLRATGALYTGSQIQSFAAAPSASSNVMFGNPYQSAVDVTEVFANANTSNINPNLYYVYDPTLASHGMYVTVDLVNATNTGGTANKFLQPGQGAQAATLAAGTSAIEFTEANKAPGNFTVTNATGGSGIDNILSVQLYTTDNFNNGGPLHDGLIMIFGDGLDNGITPMDAVKPMNFYENLGIDHNGTYLSLERREMPIPAEIYQLYTAGYSVSEYTLKLAIDGLDASYLYLEDRFTGTSTLLNTGETTYSFTVDAGNAQSLAADRFYIRTAERLGVGENGLLAGIRLFPNPLNGDIFYINAPRLNGEQLEVSISDLSGRRIFNQTLECSSNTVTVPMGNDVATGVYLVTLTHGGESHTYRLIKE